MKSPYKFVAAFRDDYIKLVDHLDEWSYRALADIMDAGVLGKGRSTTAYRLDEMVRAGVLETVGINPVRYRLVNREPVDALFIEEARVEQDASATFCDRVADYLSTTELPWVHNAKIARTFGTDVKPLNAALAGDERFVAGSKRIAADKTIKLWALKSRVDADPEPVEEVKEPKRYYRRSKGPHEPLKFQEAPSEPKTPDQDAMDAIADMADELDQIVRHRLAEFVDGFAESWVGERDNLKRQLKERDAKIAELEAALTKVKEALA